MKKYIQVKEAILADIRSGRLKAGDQLPLREELIQHYQVTRTTLNRAIAELVQNGTLTARQKLGTFVAEQKAPKKIALVSSFQLDAGPWEQHQTDQKTTAVRDAVMSPAHGKTDLIDFRDAENDFTLLSQYDSIIWVMPNDHILPKLSALKHKVVIVNRYRDDLSFVSTNHRQAQYDITAHFIQKLGETSSLFYLDAKENSFIYSERREGFLQACEDYEKFYRFIRMGNDFETNVDSLMELDLKAEEKNIIISPTAYLTGAVLRMAYLRKLRIEEDFFYSDFDNADSLTVTGVKIPSVLQNYRRMGEEALEAAKDMNGDPVQRFIPHRLVNI